MKCCKILHPQFNSLHHGGKKKKKSRTQEKIYFQKRPKIKCISLNSLTAKTVLILNKCNDKMMSDMVWQTDNSKWRMKRNLPNSSVVHGHCGLKLDLLFKNVWGFFLNTGKVVITIYAQAWSLFYLEELIAFLCPSNCSSLWKGTYADGCTMVKQASWITAFH